MLKINKLLFILSLLILVLWAIPNFLNYYKSLDSYNAKNSELEELRVKHNVNGSVQKMEIMNFKKYLESNFSNVNIEPKTEPKVGYFVTLQIEKNKIKKFNSFIESLSLHYLVKIRDNELHFEEKEQLIEATFILEEL